MTYLVFVLVSLVLEAEHEHVREQEHSKEQQVGEEEHDTKERQLGVDGVDELTNCSGNGKKGWSTCEALHQSIKSRRPVSTNLESARSVPLPRR